MKKLIRVTEILLLAVIFLISSVNTVLAMSTADASEAVDTTKACRLRLTYQVGDRKISGMEIEIYLVATIDASNSYSLSDAFSGYSVEINGIKSQSEWDEVRDTVSAYIAADKIGPTASTFTDSDGVVDFSDLIPGIYYVRWTGNETVDRAEGFPPFMIAVPGLGEDGKWIYDVDALPKPGTLPESEKGTISVTKLWRDGNKNETRPDKITVELYKDGVYCEEVELNAAMNWTYSWETETDCVWTAVERNVPEGYSVTVQNIDGNTIRITNSTSVDPDPAPDTGDTSNLRFWIFATAASGVMLIILALLRRRRSADDDDLA